MPGPYLKGMSDTLSKFFAVIFSISGVVMVSLSDLRMEKTVPVGTGWALGGALCYAAYFVLLKRRFEHKDKMSIPMFFGKNSLRSWKTCDCPLIN
jgi:drug/metabolite transporter (DMT)-like permease